MPNYVPTGSLDTACVVITMSYLALSMTCIDKANYRNFTHNQFTFTYQKKYS